MRPKDRYQWIIQYLERSTFVDVLDQSFSDAYIEACKPSTVDAQNYGAHRVPQLGRDLAAMYKAKILDRATIGVGSSGGMGFPSWVYSYELSKG